MLDTTRSLTDVMFFFRQTKRKIVHLATNTRPIFFSLWLVCRAGNSIKTEESERGEYKKNTTPILIWRSWRSFNQGFLNVSRNDQAQLGVQWLSSVALFTYQTQLKTSNDFGFDSVFLLFTQLLLHCPSLSLCPAAGLVLFFFQR